ncbi:hypothetical protein GO491_11780 [Flavobacteriaceae bacterium Ap0902]|nr:hypothetical protein [Flavobacteriaceae bacterium Ap0902]
MIKLNNRDCTTAVKGTALGKCLILPGYFSKNILFEKGLELDAENDTLDDAKVQELIQNGKIVVLPEHLSLEEGSEEDVYETLPNGTQQFVRYGVKRYTFSYANGICFGNALASLASKKWDIAFVDHENKLIINHTENGIKGFGTAFVRKGNMTLNDGSVSTKDNLVIGFTPAGSQAMNESLAVVYAKDSVDWLGLEGVHDVRLVVENTSASDLRISVLDGCSETPIEGLDNPDYWRFENQDGSTVTPSGVTYQNGAYTISGVTAGTYNANLGTADSNVIIDAVNDFYKSNVENVTVS